MPRLPIEHVTIGLATTAIEASKEALPRLVECGYDESDCVEAFVRGYLLASANFASEHGWSDERVCEYLERFVARIRSGEAQASAEAFKAEWNAAREGK